MLVVFNHYHNAFRIFVLHSLACLLCSLYSEVNCRSLDITVAFTVHPLTNDNQTIVPGTMGSEDCMVISTVPHCKLLPHAVC